MKDMELDDVRTGAWIAADSRPARLGDRGRPSGPTVTAFVVGIHGVLYVLVVTLLVDVIACIRTKRAPALPRRR
jgi:hypothetical protein